MPPAWGGTTATSSRRAARAPRSTTTAAKTASGWAPEGGQFGLYFSPGAPFTFDNWQIPTILHDGVWTIRDQNDEAVTFVRAM